MIAGAAAFAPRGRARAAAVISGNCGLELSLGVSEAETAEA